MIREYTDSDLELLLETWHSASLIGHPFLSDEFLHRERENIRNQHLPLAKTWVYVEDGRVVGFVAMIGSEVGGLFVNSHVQRNGIGKKLLDYVKPMHENLVLNVFVENIVGRNFYKKYGFSEIGEVTDAATGKKQIRMKYPR